MTVGDWKDRAKGLGVDYSGNNPLGPGLRGAAIGVTPGLWGRADFFSQTEPMRQNALLSAINQFLPQNVQNTIGQHRSNLMGQAQETGNVLGNAARSQGAGIGVEQGLRLQSLQDASKSANDYASFVMSPEGQKQIQAALQQYFGLAQDLGMSQISPLFGMLEQRGQANNALKAGQGLGGLIGSIGGILGNSLPMGRPQSAQSPYSVIWGNA